MIEFTTRQVLGESETEVWWKYGDEQSVKIGVIVNGEHGIVFFRTGSRMFSEDCLRQIADKMKQMKV